jgi:predicted TPR repeat methyltransferase
MAAALSGEASDKAPLAYIKDLFDQYASRFDKHITQALEYNTPQLLREAAIQLAGEKARFKDALDLGCGTGLAGQVFRDMTEKLTGIDISDKMIHVAREKQIYDKLKAVELIEFLKETKQCYGLIIAADVLVYMGNLEEIFKAVKKKLSLEGVFLFSTENTDNETYHLKSSGRFAHNPEYIKALSKRINFEIFLRKTDCLRKENGQPVWGSVFAMGPQ